MYIKICVVMRYDAGIDLASSLNQTTKGNQVQNWPGIRDSFVFRDSSEI